MQFTFDSVVFNSSRLKELRAFYEDKLGFQIASQNKDGVITPDVSASYVNYQVGGGLIGFEHEEVESSSGPTIGDIVLRVSDFDAFKNRVRRNEIPIVKENRFFFMIKDPEGRTLIFEPCGNIQ